jgi:pyruvate kinase
MCFELGIRIIIVFTSSGESARLLSKYRPDAFIIAVSNDIATIKSLCISYGVIALRVPSF